MGAAWYRARADLRQRWRASLLLILIVGLAGGVVLTAVAGARRSSTAYDRFRDDSLASDLEIAFEPGPEIDPDEVTAALARIPEVAAVTHVDFPFIVPAGSGMYPFLDFLALMPRDEAFGSTIDRPRMVEGRLPSPDAPGEMAVTSRFAESAGLGVGDQVSFDAFAPQQLEALFTTGDAGPPAGPLLALTVTGVLDAPTFLSESSGAFQPSVLLSKAFGPEHGDLVATYVGGFSMRLHRGAADVPAVRAAATELYGDQSRLEVVASEEVDDKIRSSIQVIVGALLVFAVVTAVAGVVAVTQALFRHLGTQAEGEPWLAALGMTRRGRIMALVAAALPIALLGALLAFAAALLASPLTPVGVARRAEPTPGLAFDAPVLVLGSLAVAAVVLVVAVAAAAAMVPRASVVRRPSPLPRRSLVMRALGRRTVPPPASIGVGLALEPRAGSAGAVRAAVGAVAFGVAGLVAVVVFAANITTLVSTPARYGAPFDSAVSGFTGDVLADGGDDLISDPDIAELSVMVTGLGRVDGIESNTHSLELLKGDASFTLLSGRLPRSDREVVLGPATLEEVGASLGEVVTIDGGGQPVEAEVVGTAAFPVVDERSSVGRGALLTPDGLVEVSVAEELTPDVIITWADGVDVEAASEELAARTGTEVMSVRRPSEVNNLEEVAALPAALGVVLAVVAVLAIVHALATTVRSRRDELSVLRALGFRPRHLTSTLVWQAMALALVGLLAGVPLGLAGGRLVWRTIAREIGVVDDPVIPAAAVALVVPAAIVLAALISIGPGLRARRVPAAPARTA